MISGIIQVEESVEPDNSNRDLISDITKTESHNCFIIHCFKENNDKHIITRKTVYFRQAMFLRELDIALGNHALRAQLTGYSLIC